MEDVKEGGGTKSNPAAAATAATESDSPSNLPLPLPLQSSSTTPFTNLSQIDADLALARTLQEQALTVQALMGRDDYSNFESLAVDTTRFQEQGKRSHGTINCFIMYNEGILVGVDSRFSSMTSKYKPGVPFLHIFSDIYIKYKNLIDATGDTPAVGITAAGDPERNQALWAKLELFVKSGKKHIHDVAEEIGRFLYRTSARTPTEECRCFLFLAGYSILYEAYIVYYMADRMKTQMFNSRCPEKGFFHATGSSCSYAMTFLKKTCLPNKIITVTDALSSIVGAMVSAALNDGSCGGTFTVYQLTKPRGPHNLLSSMLSEKHVIDALLVGYTDSIKIESSLFVLYPNNLPGDDGLIIRLFQRLYTKGLTKLPIYLGDAQGWKIYFVQFGVDTAAVREIFKKGYHKDGFLYSEARGFDIDTGHKLVITRGSVDILRKIKNGIYKRGNA